MDSSLITSASLLVTEDCNLRCTYCFEEHKPNHMSVDTATASLRWLFGNAQKSGSKKPEVSVTLFGGEPTMNAEVCAAIVNEGCKMSRESGIRFAVMMITNSTLFPEVLVQAIKDNKSFLNFGVQLSIDGAEEAQNRYRVTRSGKGSWNQVKDVYPKWQELCTKEVSVHSCVNKDTLKDMHDNFTFFKEEGFDQIWFLPVCEEEWDDSDVELYREMNQMIFDDLDSKGLEGYSPFNRGMRGCNSVSNKPCGAGSNYCTITADGRIWPCHQFYFKDDKCELQLGDIWDGIDPNKQKLYVEYDGNDLTCESDCECDHCYRCIAVNWDLHGSIFGQRKGHYCDLMKVDKEFQIKAGERSGMGVVKENGNAKSPECCDEHTADTCDGCDIVHQSDVPSIPKIPAGSSVMDLIELTQKKINFEMEFLKHLVRMNE